ncbi:MAG TPA: hypothetical protein VMR74_05205 [Gammaproteobacteria bacterium]|nr:hypothetical protein [Gammaproteobacteria bacterium]
MIKRSVRIGSVVAVLIAALAITYQWRGSPDGVPSETDGTPGDSVVVARSETGVALGAMQEYRAPSEPSSAAVLPAERADDFPNGAPTEQDMRELVEGIDPLLGQTNLIVRAPDAAGEAPGLVDMELQFRTEGTDTDWSRLMESRIFDQVSQVSGISLVTIEAECRETICRIKLFYPPNANALSSLEQLKPLATQLGFSHVVEAATIDENDVPMSLLYLQREAA